MMENVFGLQQSYNFLVISNKLSAGLEHQEWGIQASFLITSNDASSNSVIPTATLDVSSSGGHVFCRTAVSDERKLKMLQKEL